MTGTWAYPGFHGHPPKCHVARSQINLFRKEGNAIGARGNDASLKGNARGEHRLAPREPLLLGSLHSHSSRAVCGQPSPWFSRLLRLPAHRIPCRTQARPRGRFCCAFLELFGAFFDEKIVPLAPAFCLVPALACGEVFAFRGALGATLRLEVHIARSNSCGI